MSAPAFNSAQAVRRARALLYEKWQPRGEPLVVTRGPGRLNLIGEHTDYNGGYVMPVAVDRAVVVAAAPREDQRIRAFSESLDSAAEYTLGGEADEHSNLWVKYLQGVSWVLADQGLPLRGLDAVVFSDVPRGAGLSSSAALEVAWALALLTASSQHLAPRDLALACQRAENEYVGMRCGILDQFASVFGRAHSALLVDCESLEMQVVPMKGHPVSLVVCDTNKPRALVDSEYNQRRASCEEAARLLGVPSLRHANQEMVMTARERLGEENFKRAWHVISENERVLETAAAFERGDLEAVGRMISALPPLPARLLRGKLPRAGGHVDRHPARRLLRLAPGRRRLRRRRPRLGRRGGGPPVHPEGHRRLPGSRRPPAQPLRRPDRQRRRGSPPVGAAFASPRAHVCVRPTAARSLTYPGPSSTGVSPVREDSPPEFPLPSGRGLGGRPRRRLTSPPRRTILTFPPDSLSRTPRSA